jgi:hypothetical protein
MRKSFVYLRLRCLGDGHRGSHVRDASGDSECKNDNATQPFRRYDFSQKATRDAGTCHLSDQLHESEEYYRAVSCRSTTTALGAALQSRADEVAVRGQTLSWADAVKFLWGGTGDPVAPALPEFQLLQPRECTKQICLLQVRVMHHLTSHGWAPWRFGGRYDKLIAALSNPGAAQLKRLIEQDNFEKFGRRVQDRMIRHDADTFRHGFPWSFVVEEMFGGKLHLETRFDVRAVRK